MTGLPVGEDSSSSTEEPTIPRCRAGPVSRVQVARRRGTPVPTDRSRSYPPKQSLPYIRAVQHTVLSVLRLNGQVPSLKLNQNLMKLAHFNDLGPAKQDPSSFSSISADLELADLRISSKAIDIDGYGVNVDGSGGVSVSGSDELNYQGVAEIVAKQGFITNIVARPSGATSKNGKLSFPFRVGGTIESPMFSKGKKAD